MSIDVNNNQSEIFDVARWSRSEVAIIFSQAKVAPVFTTDDELSNAIDMVIYKLGERFDATIGINWEVIELAVEDTIDEMNTLNK